MRSISAWIHGRLFASREYTSINYTDCYCSSDLSDILLTGRPDTQVHDGCRWTWGPSSPSPLYYLSSENHHGEFGTCREGCIYKWQAHPARDASDALGVTRTGTNKGQHAFLELSTLSAKATARTAFFKHQRSNTLNPTSYIQKSVSLFKPAAVTVSFNWRRSLVVDI